MDHDCGIVKVAIYPGQVCRKTNISGAVAGGVVMDATFLVTCSSARDHQARACTGPSQ